MLYLLLCIGFALALPIPAGAQEPAEAQRPPEPRVEHLYILSFNNWGELLSPGERDLAIKQLRDDPDIERIVIFCYGWGHDAEASYASYRSMMVEIERNMPAERERPHVAVIGIGWDSAQTGFRKLFNAILPFPGLANALAWPLDQLLFPISFWSKAAQADRIGLGGLRNALNEIFSVYEQEGRSHPEVFLIGHSFGTRIISGLMKSRMGPVDVSSNAFRSAPHVRGALLFQPALVSGNLDHDAEYPVMVTMSEHDHAVGFLYPVANVPLNALGFTLFEALVHQLLLDPVQKGVEMTTSTLSDVVTAPLPQRSRSEPETEPAPQAPTPEAMVRRTVARSWRTLGEVIAIPVNLAFTLVALPLDYTYIQTTGLATHPVDHVMDTLAQLPVVEIAVDGVGRAAGREVPWGRRGKGFFTLGSIYEGMGRMSPPLALYKDPTVYTPEELDALERVPSGVFVVDATERISTGAFGADLANPLVDYTLGWLDPLGAHSDFTNPRAIALAAWMASGGRTALDEPATASSE
jgi:hypothetical protein